MRRLSSDGFVMPMVLAIIVAMTIIFSAVAQLVVSNISLISGNIKSQKALNVAEAGINYYLWHLSHNPTDYRDGQTTPTTPDPVLGYGPYVHNYVDDNNNISGTYTIWISPQGAGSTIMKVRSIGKINGEPGSRTVEAQIGAPSFASYSLISDQAIWVGAYEQVNGPIHSNIGIRMDGPNTGDVTSARATYVPSSSYGGNGVTSQPGVWCSTSITTPVNCNTRSKDNWIFPQPTIDFNLVSSSLCTMKKVAFGADAATSGLAGLSNACSQVPTTRTASYLPQRSTSGSYATNRGYLIQLNNNNTYDLYQVNGENDRLSPYTSALTLVSVASAIAIPSTGTIFAEDNVWVRTSTTFNGRVTIGSGRLASTSATTHITIADDLLYSAKNGTVNIGLVSEGDVVIAPYAPPTSGAFTFELNAAILAQSGRAYYPGRYRADSSRCTRGWTNANQTLYFYGSVSTRNPWTWSWYQGGACGDAVNDGTGTYISGFLHNTTEYDDNLLYAAPPNFPLTGTHNILSWREILTRP